MPIGWQSTATSSSQIWKKNRHMTTKKNNKTVTTKKSCVEGSSERIMSKSELSKTEKIWLLGVKEILDVEDAVLLTGLSMQRLYALCSLGEIPHYKSAHVEADKTGKTYFKKSELEAWMTSQPKSKV